MNRKKLLVIIKSTLKEYSKDDVALMAAGLTYYAFFSLFPMLLLLVTLASFVVEKADAEKYIFDNVARVAPGTDLPKLIGDIITKTYESRKDAGILLLVGIGTLAFSASNAFETLDKAINRAWNTEKVPTFIAGKLTSFAMILGVFVLLALSLVISTVISRTQAITKSVVGEIPGSQVFWGIVDFAASLALVFAVFIMLYRFLPRTDVRFRDVWLGALLASIAWVIVKQLFAAYLGSSFANYNAVYGTMGTVIALLTWIYISSVIILFGAEFASETHRVRTVHAQVVEQATGQSKKSPWFSDALER
jgi:membrane protein